MCSDLAGGTATPATWTIARSAADGLTTRILRQVAGIGAIDTAKGRQDRVFGTALDAAWARAGGRAAARR